MSNPRRKIPSTEKELLFAQVKGICPLCGKILLYKKKNWYGKYQIAHIYPLNPDLIESELLENEERLSNDSNSLDNLLPLCSDCHEEFDKPRTVEEYRQLYDIKKKLIEEEKIKGLYFKYTISEEILLIINSLSNQTENIPDKLEYTALRIDDKLRKDFSPILKKHIVNDVTDYYAYMKNIFKEIEKNNPGQFDLIANHIKSFYLDVKLKTDDQELIYNKMAEWIRTKAPSSSIDACKVIIAFFIQNCEVFEYVP